MCPKCVLGVGMDTEHASPPPPTGGNHAAYRHNELSCPPPQKKNLLSTQRSLPPCPLRPAHLCACDDVVLLSQNVHQLALALITPLGSEDHRYLLNVNGERVPGSGWRDGSVPSSPLQSLLLSFLHQCPPPPPAHRSAPPLRLPAAAPRGARARSRGRGRLAPAWRPSTPAPRCGGCPPAWRPGGAGRDKGVGSKWRDKCRSSVCAGANAMKEACVSQQEDGWSVAAPASRARSGSFDANNNGGRSCPTLYGGNIRQVTHT